MQNALTYAWFFDQIFIVDNSEGNNSSLASQIPNAIYIANGKNLGIAKALNQGIEAALIENSKGHDYRWVMTMDQDSVWDKDLLEKYIALCIEMNAQDSTIKSFAPNIEEPKSDPPKHSTLGIWKRKIYSSITKKQYQEKKGKGFGFVDDVICSGNVLEIASWKEVGKFEEKLFLYYVDVDLCWKLREAGLKIYLFKEIPMKHNTADKVKPPRKKTFLPGYLVPKIPKVFKDGDPVRFFYIMRNSFYISKRHPDYINMKSHRRGFRDRTLGHCVFNRKAFSNIKVLIRAYRDYKQTLLPLLKDKQ